MKLKNLKLAACVAFGLALFPFMQAQAATAVETHGPLSVKGNQIVDVSGKPASFAGPSLFWSNTGWGADRYYNADVVAYVQKEWNATIIRAAIGADMKGGYAADPEGNFAKAERVVDAAIAQGMYVIVDWHSHNAEKDPVLAIKFFERVANKYGKAPNLIYEIYNEPLQNVDWSKQIKPYAEQVIAKIRAIDPDNLIIVGTQTWSQDVDKAAADPIKGFSNIAYTLHFYAGSHKQELRDKAQKALDSGIALMITEWGTVNANGDGGLDKKESDAWIAFAKKNNLSMCNWALNDKKEGASQLKPGTAPDGKWTDANLTESGLYVKDMVLNWDKVK
ncbi:glycoside hydrolase family 5 protein [Cellvibrio sp.]|uniref:glycoside hydrolase family 5 protein n=1 Tax=Cellvibrio sp. TaxID=1965322 RepID=UPI003964892A